MSLSENLLTPIGLQSQWIVTTKALDLGSIPMKCKYFPLFHCLSHRYVLFELFTCNSQELSTNYLTLSETDLVRYRLYLYLEECTCDIIYIALNNHN
jgi:hypothetical protein